MKSIELGGRAADGIVKDLRRGYAILEDAFGAGFFPVLVPPWNRIDDALHPYLKSAGFTGLSVFGKRPAPEVTPGVTLINTHVDPIDWRGTRGYLGDDIVLERLIEQLDEDEPIGVLSHHLVMDEPCWTFLERLFSVLWHHPAARICSASTLFASSKASKASKGQAA